ncbi:MAG: DUF3016 domain-containing protein [Gammaproteobacteria bacterium]|nr:DUF3016 domain-containing protein [Gammaproteobacteria bacterium]
MKYLFLLLALTAALPAAATANPIVDVQWTADTGQGAPTNEMMRAAVNDAFHHQAARWLPPGARLEVRIQSFGRAGRAEPWGPPAYGHVRFLRGVRSPGMQLRYRAYDPARGLWLTGEQRIVHQAPLPAAARSGAHRPFAHERYMVARWIRQLGQRMR